MLQQAFLNIFDMSVTAGYCVIFVMVIRFFMRRLPRSYSYVLWAVVFLRLLIPSLPESDWSLIPRIPFVGQEQVQEEQIMNDYGIDEVQNSINISDNVAGEGGVLDKDKSHLGEAYPSNSRIFGKISVLSMEDRSFDETIYQTELPASQLAQKPAIKTAGNEKALIKVEPLQVSSLIWFLMSIVFMLYGVASNFLFQNSLKGAEWVAPNTYEVDGLQTAFIMGVIKTRIYLPANLSEEYRRYVITHEETHRRRGDNLIKHIAYILTCIHWFNPLVWIAFYFMCRDMEMSCDEQVLRTLGVEEKKAYSIALLSVASGRKLSLGIPLAFSETSTKSRIINVLKYRKPKFWAACVASTVIVAVMTGLLCNPSGQVVSAGAEPEQDGLDALQSVEVKASEAEKLEAEESATGNLESGQLETETLNKAFLNYVIPEEIDGKKVITLGLPCGSEDVYGPMHEVVMKYNEQSTEYYVEIISFTDDWQKLEASQHEIMKMLQNGESTDILYLSWLEKEELAMSGVLVDLNEFMTEEDWNQVYVGNILDATTIGDKLYAIGPEFAICTFMADERLTEGAAGWTAEELGEYLEKKGNGIRSFVATSADESYVQALGSFVIDDFVDWENYRCNFKTEEFYKILELSKAKEDAKTARKREILGLENAETEKKEELPLEKYENANQEVRFGFITSVLGYHTYDIIYDERAQSMGFPTTKGSGVAVLLYDQLGISNFSDNKEAAWDFVKFYLEERGCDYAFPILQEQLYKTYEDAKVPVSALDQYSLKTYTYAATNADVQAVVDLIAQADREYHYNVAYTNILEEEVVSYYKGEISVEEAAARMEERMNEYLVEFK